MFLSFIAIIALLIRIGVEIFVKNLFLLYLKNVVSFDLLSLQYSIKNDTVKRQINTIYIIAALLTCIFLTSGFATILPVLSQHFSGINYEKTDAETEKEIEKSGKEYYHLATINVIPTDIKYIELAKTLSYTNMSMQLFIRTILTPPPEKGFIV